MILCGDTTWIGLVLKSIGVAMFPLFATLVEEVTIICNENWTIMKKVWAALMAKLGSRPETLWLVALGWPITVVFNIQ